MENISTQSVHRTISRIIFYQFLIIIGLALMLFAIKGMRSGFSLLGGGMAYGLPTLLFANFVSWFANPAALGRFMIAFFAGEALKLVLSGMLFLAVIVYGHATLGGALVGLLSAILAFWIASTLCLFRSGAAA